MHCGSCTSAVESALSSVEGVESASADLKSQTVQVVVSESAVRAACSCKKTNGDCPCGEKCECMANILIEAMEDVGYEAQWAICGSGSKAKKGPCSTGDCGCKGGCECGDNCNCASCDGTENESKATSSKGSCCSGSKAKKGPCSTGDCGCKGGCECGDNCECASCDGTDKGSKATSSKGSCCSGSKAKK